MNSLYTHALAAAVAAAIGFGGGWRINGWRLGTAVADCRAESARTLKAISDKTAEAEREYRAKETQWKTKLEGVTHDGQEKIDAAKHDAAVADAERDGLRHQLAAYRAAARAATDTGTAAAGPATPDALDLLAELFARADDRAGELARIADLAHAAGGTCERAYDALTAGAADAPP